LYAAVEALRYCVVLSRRGSLPRPDTALLEHAVRRRGRRTHLAFSRNRSWNGRPRKLEKPAKPILLIYGAAEAHTRKIANFVARRISEHGKAALS
jgi:hypothetical protein